MRPPRFNCVLTSPQSNVNREAVLDEAETIGDVHGRRVLSQSPVLRNETSTESVLCCEGDGRSTKAATAVARMRDDRDVCNRIVPNLVSGESNELVVGAHNAKCSLGMGLAPTVVPLLRLARCLKLPDRLRRSDRSREARVTKVERVRRPVADEGRPDNLVDRPGAKGSELALENINVGYVGG